MRGANSLATPSVRLSELSSAIFQHDVSDRQIVHRQKTRPERRTAVFIDLADVRGRARGLGVGAVCIQPCFSPSLLQQGDRPAAQRVDGGAHCPLHHRL